MSSPPKASSEKYVVPNRRLAQTVEEEVAARIKNRNFRVPSGGVSLDADYNPTESVEGSDCSSPSRLPEGLTNSLGTAENLDSKSQTSAPKTPIRGRGLDTYIANTSAPGGYSGSPSPLMDKAMRRLNLSSKPVSSRVMEAWRQSPADMAETPSVPRTPRVPSGVMVDNSNAQRYYSVSECLFVANLEFTMDDVEIERELTNLFSPVGQCYIKVLRDKKSMPQAFIQFTCRKDAKEALKQHTGLVLHGRLIRIEFSKANREYHLARKDHTPVSAEEARTLLKDFGAIEDITQVTKGDLSNGYKGGLFVMFENYQSGRDACRRFESSPVWLFEECDRFGLRLRAQRQAASNSRDRAEISNYEIIRRSIFVGNLTQRATDKALKDLCSQYGVVLDVDILRTPSSREGCDANIFAFVEFTNGDEAQLAVEGLFGHYFQGKRLKVDLKKSQEVLYAQRNAPMSRAAAGPSLYGTAFGMSSPSGVFLSPPMPRAPPPSPATPMGQFAYETAYQYQPSSAAYGPAGQIHAPVANQAGPASSYPGLGSLAPAFTSLGGQAAQIGLGSSVGVVGSSVGGISSGTEVPASPSLHQVYWDRARRVFVPRNPPFPPSSPYGYSYQGQLQTQNQVEVQGQDQAQRPVFFSRGRLPSLPPALAQFLFPAAGPPGGAPPPARPRLMQGTGSPRTDAFASLRAYLHHGHPPAQGATAEPVSPSLAPTNSGPMVEDGGHWGINAGSNAGQHDGVEISNAAYGTSLALPSAQTQAHADAVMDSYFGQSAMISPKKLDAANQPCKGSDTIAGPGDADLADSNAERSTASMDSSGSEDNESGGVDLGGVESKGDSA